MTDGGTEAAGSPADETMAPAEQDLRPRVPFGEWPSPIAAADVARGGRRLSCPVIAGGDVWWQESRPDENGRVTVMCQVDGGNQTALLPAPWNARTRVHEYGGLAYLPVPAPEGRAIAFANFTDQRLYLAGRDTADGAAQPAPLTPDPVTVPDNSGTGMLEPSALRYADFVLAPGDSEIWCVQERHDGGAVTRSIVAVPLDGSAADDPAAIRQLVTGSDFYAFPTPSPDGSALAWISWNHPHMPWDGTELRVAAMADGVPGASRLLKGSIRESVLAPVWKDNASLYIATDWTGWWNIYELGLSGQPPQALFPADEEFAGPLWQLGPRPFALLGDGRLAVVHGQGGTRLSILDPESCELSELDTP
ncbi:MAG: hypothetical protein ACRDNZ_03180, partial [Streptosporangiaceae bacterium]